MNEVTHYLHIFNTQIHTNPKKSVYFFFIANI